MQNRKMGEKTSFFGDLKNELKQELKTDIFGFKSFKADPSSLFIYLFIYLFI